jgi:cyanophycinase
VQGGEGGAHEGGAGGSEIAGQGGGGSGGATPGKGGLALVGGGAEDDPGVDPSWSAKAYGWIVERSGKGKVAILASSPQSEFLPDYFKSLGAEDAYNLTLPDKDAADADDTKQKLAQASAIFLKGGNQAKYLTAFTGTAVQAALIEGFAQGKVLAGTSAGAHVLSEVVYDAAQGGVYPEEALRDPYVTYISFTEGFLGVLPSTLVDTHFTTRGRLARLPAFLARLAIEQPSRDLLGIGLDERTALLVEPGGLASVVGRGAVTFLRRTTSSKAAATSGSPPSFSHLALDVLTEGYSFDLVTRTVVAHPPGAQSITSAPFTLPAASISLYGDSASSAQKGAWSLQGVASDPDAYRKGLLTLTPAEKAVGGALVLSRLFHKDELDFIENRFGGALWALGQGPSVALLLDDGGATQVGPDGVAPQAVSHEPAMLLLDARKASERAPSPYAPQQGAALVGATLHLLRSGDTWTP